MRLKTCLKSLFILVYLFEVCCTLKTFIIVFWESKCDISQKMSYFDALICLTWWHCWITRNKSKIHEWGILFVGNKHLGRNTYNSERSVFTKYQRLQTIRSREGFKLFDMFSAWLKTWNVKKCSVIPCAFYKIVKMEDETLLEHLTRSELIEKFSNAANYTVLFCE